MEKNNTITVAFGNYWITTRPYLQNNRNSAAVISNIYEPLVYIGEHGTVNPLIASSWSINDNFTKFTFKIDRNKKFSDGTPITAEHIKKAWEFGLGQVPKSHNSSLQDVMYKIVGFEEFKHKHTISGIKVLDEDTLEINFKTPFRQALEELSHRRFSIFLLKNQQCLGSGRYIIKEEKDHFLHLVPNKLNIDVNERSPEFKLIVCEKHSIKECLAVHHQIDVFDSVNIAITDNDIDYDYAKGQATSHALLLLNGTDNSILHDQKMRQALQYLITKNHVKDLLPSHYQNDNFELSFQTYLPFQKGYIENEVVEKIISDGKDYVDILRNKLKQKPLFVMTAKDWNNIKSYLDKLNLKYSPKSGEYSFKEILKKVYEDHSDIDMIFLNGSISGNDPDSIYHILGKNGAIHSPMLSRQRVMELLEKGRDLIESREIDLLYSEVNKEILRSVPYIHLGFLHGATIYNKKRIKINKNFIRRKDLSLNIYSLE